MKVTALLTAGIIAGIAIFACCAPISFAAKYAAQHAGQSKAIDVSKAPGYKDALSEFKAGHWGPAADKFEKIDGAGWHCDLVHYYLAQCYQQTNQLKQAELHYAWLLTYSKNPTLLTYAQSASQQLEYYGDHRNYAGQGNNFDHGARSRGGAGGGGAWGAAPSAAPSGGNGKNYEIRGDRKIYHM